MRYMGLTGHVRSKASHIFHFITHFADGFLNATASPRVAKRPQLSPNVPTWA